MAPPPASPSQSLSLLGFCSKVGAQRGAGTGFELDRLRAPRADATGEFGFFLSHISFCHIWSPRATGSETPAQMVGSQSEMNYIPAQSKQTIAHPAGQVGGPGEGLYIVLNTFLH